MDKQIVKVESSDKVSDETVTQIETETEIETDTKSSAPLLLEHQKVGNENNGYLSHYPLESYVTYMSHRNLQGAPTESSENLTLGQIPLRIRKDDRVTNNKPLTDKELEIYKINYNIFNILSGAAMKEAEKVSCRPGCKGAQQVYHDTLTKMFEPVNKQNEETNNCQNSIE